MPPQVSSSGSTSPRLLDHTSWRLLARAKRGDASAFARFVTRYLPELRRWTHGRLPRWARTIADTTDLVHDAVLRTLRRLDGIEPRGRRALGAYLRAAVRNRIRDEHRRIARRGMHDVRAEQLPDPAPSPLQAAMTSEMEARYRAALARLEPADRDLIVAHVELDYSHEQLGCMTGRSPNGARMALQRAVRRLAEQLRDA
jgi:RNA polymerase sigma factor (sigma-70 family)